MATNTSLLHRNQTPLMQQNGSFPLLSLPLDVLKLIFDRLGTRALFRLAQTNRVLFDLVIPHLYKDFRVTVRRRKEDLDERLTSALDTLTSDGNNYAAHIHDFAVAGEWFRSYAPADSEYAKKGKLSPGVLMLNSLVKIALLKMTSLESFAWDIRDVPLTRGLVQLLQNVPSLRNLRFRLTEKVHPNLRASGLDPCFSGFKNIRILTIMLIETMEQLTQVGDIVANSPDMVGIKVALKPGIPGSEGMDLSKILFRGSPCKSYAGSELANLSPPDENRIEELDYNDDLLPSSPSGEDKNGTGEGVSRGSSYDDSQLIHKHQFVSLKLYRVMFPASSNHLSHVIDFSRLVRLSLWQCGTHPAFWRSLTATSSEKILPRLQCIITDDAIPELAEFLGSFSGLQEFYLVHSSGAMTLESLTKGLLKHKDCLRCLAVYHLQEDCLVFDRKALRTFLKKCVGLREVALSVKDEDWSYFLHTLEYLKTIIALHILLDESPTSEHIAGTLGSLMAAAVGPLQDLEYVVVNDKYFRVEGSSGDLDVEESSDVDDGRTTTSDSQSSFSALPEGGYASSFNSASSSLTSSRSKNTIRFDDSSKYSKGKRDGRKRRAVKYVDLDPDQIDNINIFTVLRTTRR